MRPLKRVAGGLTPEAMDYYSDGVWYDAEYVHIRYDIPYYVRVAAETQGEILELACGTGRLSIPMAEVGAKVLGLDIAPAMIAQANAKREKLPPGDQARLAFQVADMRSVRLGRTFDAVVLGFNTLMHMIDDDDLAGVLDTAREHLAPGGHFHFDIHVPFPDAPPRDPEVRYDPQEMIDPRTRERYIVTENNTYDPRTQINTMRFFYQQVDRNGNPVGDERMARLDLRVFFPRELDRWLHVHGFEVVGDWEDLERKQPFTGAGGRRVVMAKRR
ncbi:class I SAM-dependent methyltransferase [Myxococcota bacterium]|nr:class I SAM-dependent methyltransferase [Myxococcota bacterium]